MEKIDRMVTVELCSFFFFQAEDGIRDTSVTGVQTCALPIWRQERNREQNEQSRAEKKRIVRANFEQQRLQETRAEPGSERSEERRVGKECRSRGWRDHENKKKKAQEGEGTQTARADPRSESR